MGSIFRVLLRLAGVLVIAVPLSIVATILLFPLWSWLEAATGIESVGHSGPAEWCYAVVFVVIAASGILMVLMRRKSKAGRANAA